MITASIVLVAAAAVLLVLGLLWTSTTLFYLSISSSAVAALALLAGVRQLPRAQLPEDDFDVGRAHPAATTRRGGASGRAPVWDPLSSRVRPVDAGPPTDHAGPGPDRGQHPPGPPGASQAFTTDQPAAQVEPEQRVSSVQAEAVAALRTEVAVIDGRPLYHVAGCSRLVGQAAAWRPVAEVVELGFIPCGLCEPVTVLLRQSEAQ